MLNGTVMEGVIYLVAAVAILFMFGGRRKQLSGFGNDLMPELAEADFAELKNLLKLAYERGVYLGVSVLLLGYASLRGGEATVRLCFAIIMVCLFLYNIPPRHRIMKLLADHGLAYQILRDRGIRL